MPTGANGVARYLQGVRNNQVDGSFCVSVANGKACSCFVTKDLILFIDSHEHDNHGGKVAIYCSDDKPGTLIPHVLDLDAELVYVCVIETKNY